MTAIKVQISFETLVETITSLDLEGKYKLREILDNQLFELEEMENAPEILAEVEIARKEYEAGDYQVLDEYPLKCKQRTWTIYEDQGVPRKIRELKSALLKAGFTFEPGKGSHTKWSHPLLSGKLTLSGKDGDDAKTYQEKDVETALKRLEQARHEEKE